MRAAEPLVGPILVSVFGAALMLALLVDAAEADRWINARKADVAAWWGGR